MMRIARNCGILFFNSTEQAFVVANKSRLWPYSQWGPSRVERKKRKNVIYIQEYLCVVILINYLLLVMFSSVHIFSGAYNLVLHDLLMWILIANISTELKTHISKRVTAGINK